MFNITNTPQFGFPNNNVTSNSFGTVSSVLNSARELQFAFKLRLARADLLSVSEPR